MKVVSIRQLTLSDLENLPSDVVEEFQCEDTNEEDLVSQDYVIGTIESEGKIVNFVHAYPGDNAVGVIFDRDYNVLASVGEGVPGDTGNPYIDWYYELEDKGLIEDTFLVREIA
jgi:hypothetical protein